MNASSSNALFNVRHLDLLEQGFSGTALAAFFLTRIMNHTAYPASPGLGHGLCAILKRRRDGKTVRV